MEQGNVEGFSHRTLHLLLKFPKANVSHREKQYISANILANLIFILDTAEESRGRGQNK